MQDKQREQRRQKRAEKKKKERADASRPGVGGPASNQMDPLKGRTWPVGECYVSENADERGASIEIVVSRSRPDGTTVVAAFELDRSGPGLVSARAVGGLRKEHVTGECARLSERSGRSMVGCSGALAASLVRDARQHGTSPEPSGAKAALSLLDGIPSIELPTAFGPEGSDAPSPKEGAQTGEQAGQPSFWTGLRKRLIG